jgi:hypothetical protein
LRSGTARSYIGITTGARAAIGTGWAILVDLTITVVVHGIKTLFGLTRMYVCLGVVTIPLLVAQKTREISITIIVDTIR